MTRGRVEILPIDSQVLAGNPLGDPTRREVPVYLPPGYDDGATAYPVLYVLAGFTGFGRSQLNRSAWDEAIDQRMDRLIAAGCPPAILVLPDCFTRLGGSQYVNSTALGRYEDHLLEEVVPTIDERFRTRAQADGRGVLGKSSGGYGALRMGLFHADKFGAVASHSGDLYFEYCYKSDFPRFLNAVNRHGGVQEFLEQFFAKQKLGSDDIISISMLAMAAAYSPEPTQPQGIDLPFDLYTGELRPDVWQRWLQNDPVELVAAHQDNLRRLRLLFVDCGIRDEYHLHYGARLFTQRCRAHDVPIEHQEFDDDHRGVSYRYDVSIPRLVRALNGS